MKETRKCEKYKNNHYTGKYVKQAIFKLDKKLKERSILMKNIDS